MNQWRLVLQGKQAIVPPTSICLQPVQEVAGAVSFLLLLFSLSVASLELGRESDGDKTRITFLHLLLAVARPVVGPSPFRSMSLKGHQLLVR